MKSLAILLCLLPMSGCFRARVDIELFAAGDGSIQVELSIDRKKIPPMLGDPLQDVGSFEDLRRYTGPGIVAWAEPIRGQRENWDTVQLEAFFDDLNELRFLRERETAEGEKPVYATALAFAYDESRLPGHVALQVDLDRELAEPLTPPEREGLDLTPEMLRTLATMFRPLLGDLELSLHLHAPGDIRRASGFTLIQGSTASIVADRDRVLQALSESAGGLLDAPAFLADDAAIDWRPRPEDAARRRRFAARHEGARRWWGAQIAAARAVHSP